MVDIVNFFKMADTDILFLSTINIYEMVATFQFCHNGRCWYSISIDNLQFFHMINIYQMAAILFIMTNTPGKMEMQIFHWFSFQFCVGSVFPVTHPKLHFNP